jgi:tetratricopeptide (TPR) repeat protein
MRPPRSRPAQAGARPVRAGRVLALALGLASSALLASCASSKPPAPAAQEWYELGNAWLDKGEWKRAGQAYSRALALEPGFAGASFNLARALAEANDYDESLRVLDALAKRDPGNVRVKAAKAYALFKKGDATAALEAYREALALDPYAPDAVYNAALLELASGDVATAAADLDRLTKAKADDGQALLLLGRARDKLSEDASRAEADRASDRLAALDAYEKAKALGKADAEALERMGSLYNAGKRYSEAMDAFDAATKADPKRAAAWFSLARLRLVVAADSEAGLAALKSALDSGFSDKESAAALLDEPDLIEREKVLDLLKAKSLAE